MASITINLDVNNIVALFKECPEFEEKLIGRFIGQFKNDILTKIVNVFISEIKDDTISQLNDSLVKIKNEVFDYVIKETEKVVERFGFHGHDGKFNFYSYKESQLDEVKTAFMKEFTKLFDEVIKNAIYEKLELIGTTDAIDKKVEFYTTSVVSSLIRDKFEIELANMRKEIKKMYS